jgi:LPS sulfotransferase NodH
VLEAPLPENPTAATSSYFVCSVQRSGTWLLAGLLDSTRVAGHPHDYFAPETQQANHRRWGVESFEEYVGRVLEVGTTENGVFGSLLMWGEHGPPVDPLSDVFPKPRFVHLWRDDVVAQAVSWSIAGQTGYYHHWNRPGGTASYSVRELDGLARLAYERRERWREWFSGNGVEPLEVRFEDLVSDQEGTARSVLEHLGLEVDCGVVIAAKTAPANSDLASEWLERYRRDRSA